MSFHSKLRGLDLHAPSNELVENNTGSDIPYLKVVSLDGMGTIMPQVVVAQPLSIFNFGITTGLIKNGKTGLITCLGFMFDVDTSAWTVHTELYSDNSGNLTSTINGTIVARVVKQDVSHGVIYVLALSAAGDQDVGWDIHGNLGTDSTQDFLGTTDAEPLVLRTNNIQAVKIDINGRVGIGPDNVPTALLHLKGHAGTQASGLKIDTFVVSSDSAAPVSAFVIPMSNPSVNRVEFVAMARQDDGSERAMFKRSGLFYRQLSNVQKQGNWLSDQTIKSDNDFDVTYQMTANTLILRVKNANAVPTTWTGHITLESI